MIKIHQVHKLIVIENNEIQLINTITINNKPVKIVSFLGNAQTGKSTLMNCYVSYIMGTTVKKFNTISKLKTQCTTGIDMLLLEFDTYDLILLDVQGLELQDYRDDCKLMLFVYLISNLVIYCPKTILDNSVLLSLQSLTSVITYIDNIETNINKPSLLFRPRDIDDDTFDSDDNLHNMLYSDVVDQFTNVRESIKKLFESIESRFTLYLDNEELKMLSNDKFIRFINKNENGFENFCNLLDNTISNVKYHLPDILNQNINKIIKYINGNKKIDFAIFDITKRDAEINIKEWILESIDRTRYDIEIISDGTQYNFDTHIKPRIDYQKLILDKFDERFIKTSPIIRDKYRNEIKNTFDKHLLIANKNAIDIATKELDMILTKINTYKVSIVENKHELIESNLSVLNCYITESIWLNIIKEEYEHKLNNKLLKLRTRISEAKHILKNVYDLYISQQIELIKTFMESSCNKPIDDIYIDNLFDSFELVVDKINIIFQKTIVDKISYQLDIIHVCVCDDKIHIEPSQNYMELSDILSDIKKSDEKCKMYICDNNLMTKYRDYDYTITEYIKKEYNDAFYIKREQKLAQLLNNINDEFIIPQLIYIKKAYTDSVTLKEKIINGGNEVDFIDIFDNLLIKTTTPDFNQSLILSKYAFIVNKLKIHKIYTTKDFYIRYKKIYKYILALKNSYILDPGEAMSYDINFGAINIKDEFLKYNIAVKIIDILFEEAINA